MIGLRHTDEWVGALVLLAAAIFLGVILQAGVLRDWFRPVSHLRVVLPEAGAAGLSVGADVEILGTQMGTVRRIVIATSRCTQRLMLTTRPAASFAAIAGH